MKNTSSNHCEVCADLDEKEMESVIKTEAEATPLTVDLQQKPNGQRHTFNFCYQNKTYAVSCNTSQTVYDALDTSQSFKLLKEKNEEKELLIKRQKEPWEITGAAVKSEFPCCLIQKDEILNIDFIKVRKAKNQEENENNEENENQERLTYDPEMLVTFNIKTKGGGELKCIMKNLELSLEVEDVCMYGFKDETLKDALSRDGRFIEKIFKRNCVLQDLASNIMYELTNYVDYMNRKHFQIIVMRRNNQLEEKNNIKTKSEDALAEGADPNKHTPKTKGKSRKTTECKSPSIKCEIIPDSEVVVNILHSEYKDILNMLKQMNDFEIQKFFRVEFGKSSQSFSEVKKVKEVMNLSNSVCQIRSDGSARGTGFLLFNRFILTNAHVIGVFNLEKFNPAEFTAVFGYEDLVHNGTKRVPIKDLTSYRYGKDEKGNHLDYALLELNSVDDISGFPELFSHYRNNSPNNKSQICIVGHPGTGVKKMDPCFIIGRENQQEAADKHVSENVEFYHVISQRSLEDKWEFSDNQITYDSCFFHGSSGSPVFDVDCKLIAIHTGGYVYPGEGEKTRSVMEYAYAMQPILDYIKAQARIKGNQEIVDILEGNSDGSDLNQTVSPMENK